MSTHDRRYCTDVPLRAAFFDVGDTLVEHWAPREVVNARARAQICASVGERPWLDDLLAAELAPVWPSSLAQQLAGWGGGAPRFEPSDARQETERWYRAWLEEHGIELDGIDLDRLRSAMCVPLDEVSTPVKGAFDALRWCADAGLRVVLVTNTLSRGDEECLEDWRRFGLRDAIHGIVSSHSAGWSKPHPMIFERALAIAGARADEAMHVGDNLITDVFGAQQLGLKAVWRRTPRPAPPSDERGAPPSRERREAVAACQHPSERLDLDHGHVRCAKCGSVLEIKIRPDAIVDDLTPIPDLLRRWAGAAA